MLEEVILRYKPAKVKVIWDENKVTETDIMGGECLISITDEKVKVSIYQAETKLEVIELDKISNFYLEKDTLVVEM